MVDPSGDEFRQSVSGGEIRVLHVDDEPDVGELTARLLEREYDAFTVETEIDPREALGRLEADGFDCVVSDYQMPGMDGLELLETVREEFPDLPFVLFTGKGSEEIAAEAIAAGVTEYLQKGTGTSQYTVLGNRIRNAVERERELREAKERFEKVFEYSHDALLIIDPDREEIYDANQRACALLGYSYGELMSLSPTDIHPDDIDRFREFVDTVTDEGEGWRDDLLCYTCDGKTVPVEVSASMIEIDGRPYMLAIVRERNG